MTRERKINGRPRALRWVLLIGLLASAHSAAWAATVAQIQLHCLAIRFQAATNSSAPGSSFMLTTDSTGADLNGELAPLPSGGLRTHGSFFVLLRANQRSDGIFYLDVPNASDANTNGIPDFFEVDLPVTEIATSGSFESADADGKVAAVWQREAKSREGTCRVTLTGLLDGLNLTFAHKFQILEYSGALPYRNIEGETNVTASVTLTQKGTNLTLSGNMVFEKTGAARLGLQSGLWKDAKTQTIAYHAIDELPRQGNEYRAPLSLQDGDVATRGEDYVSWLLRIVDPNDTNGNGVPDLSDEGGKRVPPTISLSRSGTNLLLSISGEIGKLHEVETTPALGQVNWSLVTNVTVTSDPQIVSLRVPTNPRRTAFWRVHAR
ncbi:MAG: hypothetical protein HYY23_08860 [Verrucomicrobia bacterium]|nr:hypothetical protein [Verrucomicrobiota bacterium]